MNNFIKYMYCISIDDKILHKILDLNYIPVGLGDAKFSSDWITDKILINISEKNKYYGEYTFHYFFWKNLLKEIPENEWVGFCGYRRFWKNKNMSQLNNKITDQVIKEIPEEWNDYETIIGDKLDVRGLKWSKVMKYGKLAILRNPKAIFNEKYRNIKFHFDMFHGNGILDKAIELLNHNDKIKFYEYINNKNSFNQGNMFVTRSKKIMNEYYSVLFEWLEKCENIFGFKLEGYGKTRIYAFLAERFLSYWFKENTKYLEWPVLFHDLRK